MNKLLRALLPLALCGVSAVHAAGSDSKKFNVTLTITDACKITVAPTDIDFGSNVRTADPVELKPEGVFTFLCSPSLDYSIAIDGGSNTASPAAQANPSPGDRRMRMGTTLNYVKYDLFYKDDRKASSFWGTNKGTNTVDGKGAADGKAVQLKVYALVTDVNAAAGKYDDSVTLTVSY